MWRKISLAAIVVLAAGFAATALGDASSDPNLAVWYKLDESAGLTANDSSVYDRDGEVYTWAGEGVPAPDPNWDPDGGHDGGCYVFFDDTRITVPDSALTKVKDGITVSLWLKDAWRVGQNCTFDASAGEAATFRITAYIGTAPDAEVLWRAGDDSNDTLRWDMDGGSVEDLVGWHHWALVKDEFAGNIRIYLDGLPVASKGGVSNALATVLPVELPKSEFYFRVGAKSWYRNDLKGRVDDFMVHDRAMSDDEVLRVYYSAGDLTVAWKPEPADDIEDLCEEVVLSWAQGDFADEHDVYFGTDEQAVEDATTASAEYRAPSQEPNSYDAGALETLDPGVTYYWRIDEVNDNVWAPPGSPWKGEVWQFTINDGNAFGPSPADGETAVLKEASLSWSAGCWAAEHEVYLGTDYSEVRDATTASGVHQATQSLGNTSYDPVDFDYLTDYYWRIDEVNGPTTWKGEVWSFKSQTLIVDVNCTLWYELNETEGYVAHDSSNYLNDGVVDMPEGGPPEWGPLDGQWGGSLAFNDDTAIWVPTAALSKVVNGVAIIFWAYDAGKIALNANGGDSQLLVDFGGSDVEWRAGNDTNDVLVLGSNPGGWRHWAFVKDESEGNIRIYLDGRLAASDDVVDSTLFGIRSKPFKIGGLTGQDNDFDGKIDDFIVYDRALSDNEVARQYEAGGPVGKMGVAWGPSPANREIDVARDSQLTWNPGDYTQAGNGHELFFGTSWDDVNSMTDPCATKNLDDESYDPGVLELKASYYWRVDEVNDPCLWRGQVWRFTVGDFLILDNFEQYTIGDPCQIHYTWYEQRSQEYP
ncbi:MAG: LamG domain-containing protein, partial [Planctomycetota bacterium]